MSAVAVLRRLPVPDTLPPVESSSLTERRRALLLRRQAHPARPVPIQGVLALVDARDPRDLLASDDRGEDLDLEVDFGPIATRRADLPDPVVFSRGLVQVLVEVLASQRGAQQLRRWTTDEVFAWVSSQAAARQRAARRQRGGVRRRPIVRSVRVCEPADGVAEVCAVVRAQGRTTAMALRLEGQDGRWRVTALEAG